MRIQSDVEYILVLASITKDKLAHDLNKDRQKLIKSNEGEYKSDLIYQLYQEVDSFIENLSALKTLLIHPESKCPFNSEYSALLIGYFKLVEGIYNALLMRNGVVSLKLVSHVFSMMSEIIRVSKEVIEDRYLSSDISMMLIPNVIEYKSAFDNEQLSIISQNIQTENNKKIEIERDAFNIEIKRELNKVSEAYSEGRDEIINTFKKYETAVFKVLEDAKNNIIVYKDEFENINKNIINNKNIADDFLLQAKKKIEIIDGVLGRASQVGMAGAFQKRHKELLIPMILWNILFFVCLVGITIIGGMFVQFAFLSDSGGKSTAEVISRLAVTLPLVWGAWFSAKQYSHISQLREDYAYKVAIAMTYHGYKDEAKDIHSDMSGKLLDSIVMQFADNPVRLYRDDSANSIVEAAVKNNKVSEIIAALKGGK